MKQYLKGIGIAVGVAVFAFLIYRFPMQTGAAGGTVPSPSPTPIPVLGSATAFTIQDQYLNNKDATNSVTFLSKNATTTFDIATNGADVMALLVNYVASSTSPTPYFMYTISAVFPGGDTFGEDSVQAAIQPTASSSPVIWHSTSTPIHYWGPDTTATSSKLIRLPSEIVSKVVRIKLWSSGVNAAVWIDALTKRGIR